MKEFQINELLKLRLENGATVIYVGGERFNQCKYLLVDEITGDDVLDYQRQVQDVIEEMQYTSIDEKAERYSRKLEGISPFVFEIEPEEEFWAHCSNLQVWAEHDYDTHLLHSNLSYSLLEQLADVGDVKAKIVYKKELRKELKNSNIKLFLLNKNLFCEEELIEILDGNFNKLIIKELDSEILDLYISLLESLKKKFPDKIKKHIKKILSFEEHINKEYFLDNFDYFFENLMPVLNIIDQVNLFKDVKFLTILNHMMKIEDNAIYYIFDKLTKITNEANKEMLDSLIVNIFNLGRENQSFADIFTLMFTIVINKMKKKEIEKVIREPKLIELVLESRFYCYYSDDFGIDLFKIMMQKNKIMLKETLFGFFTKLNIKAISGLFKNELFKSMKLLDNNDWKRIIETSQINFITILSRVNESNKLLINFKSYFYYFVRYVLGEPLRQLVIQKCKEIIEKEVISEIVFIIDCGFFDFFFSKEEIIQFIKEKFKIFFIAMYKTQDYYLCLLINEIFTKNPEKFYFEISNFC